MVYCNFAISDLVTRAQIILNTIVSMCEIVEFKLRGDNVKVFEKLLRLRNVLLNILHEYF